MQKQIKLKTSCEGKMLSRFVQKYLGERGTFDTDICQYTFGIDDINQQKGLIQLQTQETEIET